jgi:hypothetical protein
MTEDDVAPRNAPAEVLCGSFAPDHPFGLEHLAKRRWRMFPCVPRDKTPLLKSWPARATSELATIRGWSEEHPGCNWAVACGPGSGVWVLDVDGPEGAAALDALCQEHGGEWLNTLSVRTVRGRHFYYTFPPQYQIRNSAGRLGPGLDVRGDGGYVLVPPSIHPSGEQYRWHDPGLPIASAPVWLCEMAASTQRAPAPTFQIGILPEGQRNDGLTRLAGSMRRKGSTPDQIETELHAANMRRCNPPLDDVEVRKIAESVGRYPAGGPDPLEAAWEAVGEAATTSRYERFLALARELQLSRPGQTIALPLERVASLLNCSINLISRYRQRAVQDKRLTLVTTYIPHKRANLYFYRDTAVELVPVELSNVTSGLVTHPPSASPSYTPSKAPSYTSDVEAQSATESAMIEVRI